MRKRTLAIGDIHGCRSALDHLLSFVALRPADQLITVGDYIDRGPDSRGVIEKLIDLHIGGQLVALRGNHEIMMLGAQANPQENLQFWLQCGGIEALESYAPASRDATLEDIPQNHWHFVRHTCIDWYETERHFFVHANVDPDLPLREQTSQFLHWEFLSPRWHRPHCSGKIMICGHSEQRSGEPLYLVSAIGIDTWAYGGGWLTCLDVDTGEYWQANELGETRQGSLKIEPTEERPS